jgi:type I restriction enzyme S subunit
MKEGWETRMLGDVLHKTETIDPTKTPENQFIYVDVSSVNNTTFMIENTTLLFGKEAPSRARKLVRTGDIIFATVRPTLKRLAVIPTELNEQVCSTGYFVLRGKDFIENKYLFYYLQTDAFYKSMEKLQKGASYPAVTDGEVRGQLISYPKSLTEQQRIVSILDEAFAAIDKAKANIERNLQNAKELFQSELNVVFLTKGEGWIEQTLSEISLQFGRGKSKHRPRND